MQLKLSVDTTPTLLYLTNLSKLTNRSVKETTIDEAASIWKIAASKNKVATQAKLKQDIKFKVLRNVSENGAILSQTKKGKVWYSKDNKLTWELAGYDGSLVRGWRLGKNDFNAARALLGIGKDRIKVRTKIALDNRGLSGASFISAINTLGITDIDNLSPKSARVNVAVKSQALKNRLGYSSVNSNEAGTTVLMVNRSRIAIRRGAAGLVQGAIRIRAAYFMQNLKRDIFLNAQATLKAYPNSGITIGASIPEVGT